MNTGFVFNIQRFSIHDGPGIRTTVFMKGCPLHCWWCHNPEGRDPKPAVSMLPERCIECGACVGICPNGIAVPLALNASGRTNGHRCTVCGSCAEVCPSGARTIVGRSYTVADIMKEIDKDRIFYDESAGGVTFSGGEPLSPKPNADFLLACLEACRDRGYHRVVDTSGFAPRETILAVARLTDLFLYDLKLLDERRHRQYVGVSSHPILENLKALSRMGSNVWIRIPLIPGINDDEENLDQTGFFIASLDRPYPVHVLPYHKVGGDKYRRLGEDYALSHLEPPEREHTEAAAERLRSFGLKVKIGG